MRVGCFCLWNVDQWEGVRLCVFSAFRYSLWCLLWLWSFLPFINKQQAHNANNVMVTCVQALIAGKMYSSTNVSLILGFHFCCGRWLRLGLHCWCWPLWCEPSRTDRSSQTEQRFLSNSQHQFVLFISNDITDFPYAKFMHLEDPRCLKDQTMIGWCQIDSDNCLRLQGIFRK